MAAEAIENFIRNAVHTAFTNTPKAMVAPTDGSVTMLDEMALQEITHTAISPGTSRAPPLI